MTVIPRSQRENLPPGGNQFIAPSRTRLALAGTKGRGIESVGSTLNQIGVMAQKANDDAEFEKATIKQQTDVNSSVASNSANINNPKEFEAKAMKDVNKLFNASGKMVNFRNKNRFSTVNDRIKANAVIKVTMEFTKKTVDFSNAQYTMSSGELLNKFLDGSISKDDAVGTASILMDNRFKSGIWDAEKLVQEDLDFKGRIEKVDFVRNYEADPQKAVDTINNSKFLTTEQKTDFLFKMASRIDKAEKGTSVALETQSKIKVSKYDRLSFEGKLIPGFESEDGLSIESFNADVNNGTIVGADVRRILKQQADVFDDGGVGDERVMNKLLAELDDDFTITDDSIDQNKDFNNVQRLKLKDAIEARTNTAVSNPIAAGYRRDINIAHKATGLFSSSLLSEEISAHLASSQALYKAFLLKGEEPVDALAKTLKQVGPVPGSTSVSESRLASLKTQLADFEKKAQEENKASKGKIARGEGVFETKKKDNDFIRQNFINDINAMEQQISTNNFLEELKKHASTGK